MTKKKKTVHLDDSIHKKLKIKAVIGDTTIEKVVNRILKKELKKRG